MKEVTVKELKAMIDNKEDFQLIDVREEHEFDICNLNGKLIPMGEVMDHVAEISKDKKVVVHCRSGKRSVSHNAPTAPNRPSTSALHGQTGRSNRTVPPSG